MGISFDHDCFSGSSGVFFVSGNYGKRFMKFNEAGYRKLLAFISVICRALMQTIGYIGLYSFFMLKRKILLNFLLFLLSYKHQDSIGINKIYYGISFMKRAEHFRPFLFLLLFPCIFASLFVPLFPLIVNKW